MRYARFSTYVCIIMTFLLSACGSPATIVSPLVHESPVQTSVTDTEIAAIEATPGLPSQRKARHR